MEITRRKFLTVGGVAGATLLIGMRAEASEVKPATKVKYGMVIDLERCFGCRACMVACKVENNTPQGSFWMHVFRYEIGEYPNVRVAFLPRPCMHCDDAPCVKVCPVGARYKRDNGLVLTDFDMCIGCRYCQISCPYSVNNFNWKRPETNYYYDWKGGEGTDVYGGGSVKAYVGNAIPPYKNPDHEKLYGKEQRLVAGGGHYVGVMEKCTFCVHRLEKGLLPACVANCPVKALHFGDLNDPNSEVSRLLRENKSFRLLEELGTNPSVYYINGAPPPEGARPLTFESKEVKLGTMRLK